MHLVLASLLVTVAGADGPAAVADPTSVSADIETPLDVAADAKTQAEALGKAAEGLFGAGRYEEAIRLLEEAYALDPKPRYIYGQAQAEKLAGNPRRAIALFEAYLELDVGPEQEAAAHEAIHACEQELPDEPPPPARVVVPPTSSPRFVGDPSPPTRPPRERPRRSDTHWARNPLGGTFGGLGLVAVGVGAGLIAKGVADRRAASRTSSEVEFDQLGRSARGFGISGVSVLSVGGALLVAATVTYAVVARRRR